MSNARELAELGGSYGTGGFVGMKNRIINGAMMIDQRNAGASVTPVGGAYTLDRWQAASLSQASKLTVAQSTVAPAGFINSLLITSTSAYSITSSDVFAFGQRIEGLNVSDLAWGTASAATVTLSFWVRSSLTGTFGGSLSNSAVDRSYPFSYTVNSANTWEQKSITIPGDTSGTWLTTNGVGIRLFIGLGVGSTSSGTAGSWASADYRSATGATSVVGTNGATFYITGVQLEKGSTATSFDYRPYGTELALCQRYYYLVSNGSTRAFAMGGYQTSAYIEGVVQFPVTMRATPALEATSGTNYYGIYAGNSADTFNSLQSEYLNVNGATVYNTSEVSGTAGYAGWIFTNNASAKLAFTSEL